jgi:hypothetical protein
MMTFKGNEKSVVGAVVAARMPAPVRPGFTRRVLASPKSASPDQQADGHTCPWHVVPVVVGDCIKPRIGSDEVSRFPTPRQQNVQVGLVNLKHLRASRRITKEIPHTSTIARINNEQEIGRPA